MLNALVSPIYDLNAQTISRVVAAGFPGVYLLGHRGAIGLNVRYVGRSDTDLASRLKDHVSWYSHFQFEYAVGPATAFHEECRLWHHHGGSQHLNNSIHPDSPLGMDLKCSVGLCFLLGSLNPNV